MLKLSRDWSWRSFVVGGIYSGDAGWFWRMAHLVGRGCYWAFGRREWVRRVGRHRSRYWRVVEAGPDGVYLERAEKP